MTASCEDEIRVEHSGENIYNKTPGSVLFSFSFSNFDSILVRMRSAACRLQARC